jgi:hypothetical protein
MFLLLAEALHDEAGIGDLWEQIPYLLLVVKKSH